MKAGVSFGLATVDCRGVQGHHPEQCKGHNPEPYMFS